MDTVNNLRVNFWFKQYEITFIKKIHLPFTPFYGLCLDGLLLSDNQKENSNATISYNSEIGEFDILVSISLANKYYDTLIEIIDTFSDWDRIDTCNEEEMKEEMEKQSKTQS